jgi:hypothetical protein
MHVYWLGSWANRARETPVRAGREERHLISGMCDFRQLVRGAWFQKLGFELVTRKSDGFTLPSEDARIETNRRDTYVAEQELQKMLAGGC